jgi:hypothetical protein
MSSVAQNKKLTILFRVEPGSLGPQGKEHVDAFCSFAAKAVLKQEHPFLHWQLEPRHDKSLPEMAYRIGGKALNQAQVEKYLQVFDSTLDDFEWELAERMSALIEQYFGR